MLAFKLKNLIRRNVTPFVNLGVFEKLLQSGQVALYFSDKPFISFRMV
ncbi:hypothetical protein UCMB321_2916 [Pseudomonas batumici]|uniref:Uncharacterized protein n=1 Tax=Pseudomonas batumici TaxID=226910 RepID=A0A0C2I8U4_9PSED|nr:hypothetical protein UCMB321_2916 [Pseudomonas batumici]